MVEETVSGFRESIDQAVNVRLELNENVINASHEIINASLSQIPEELRETVLLAFGVLIFFLVSGSTYFVNLVVGFIAWIIYRLLLRSKFAYTKLKNTRREVLYL